MIYNPEWDQKQHFPWVQNTKIHKIHDYTKIYMDIEGTRLSFQVSHTGIELATYSSVDKLS